MCSRVLSSYKCPPWHHPLMCTISLACAHCDPMLSREDSLVAYEDAMKTAFSVKQCSVFIDGINYFPSSTEVPEPVLGVPAVTTGQTVCKFDIVPSVLPRVQLGESPDGANTVIAVEEWQEGHNTNTVPRGYKLFRNETIDKKLSGCHIKGLYQVFTCWEADVDGIKCACGMHPNTHEHIHVP